MPCSGVVDLAGSSGAASRVERTGRIPLEPPLWAGQLPTMQCIYRLQRVKKLVPRQRSALGSWRSWARAIDGLWRVGTRFFACQAGVPPTGSRRCRLCLKLFVRATYSACVLGPVGFAKRHCGLSWLRRFVKNGRSPVSGQDLHVGRQSGPHCATVGFAGTDLSLTQRRGDAEFAYSRGGREEARQGAKAQRKGLETPNRGLCSTLRRVACGYSLTAPSVMPDTR